MFFFRVLFSLSLTLIDNLNHVESLSMSISVCFFLQLKMMKAALGFSVWLQNLSLFLSQKKYNSSFFSTLVASFYIHKGLQKMLPFCLFKNSLSPISFVALFLSLPFFIGLLSFLAFFRFMSSYLLNFFNNHIFLNGSETKCFVHSKIMMHSLKDMKNEMNFLHKNYMNIKRGKPYECVFFGEKEHM